MLVIIHLTSLSPLVSAPVFPLQLFAFPRPPTTTVGIPQVERAITVHLCPWNAATWRNRPRLPSKACKLTAALVAKAYSAAGQAASALHTMAILQVHQAKWLKQVHEGSTDPGLIQKLCTVTDFALRATKVTARSLWKLMSSMVVQERHLLLNLAEMKDVDKARLPWRPHLPGGAVRRHRRGLCPAILSGTAADRSNPARDAPTTAAPGTRPQSARRRGRLCGTSSLRSSVPYGTRVQICGTSMCGSWTGRGRPERSTTGSGRDHRSG